MKKFYLFLFFAGILAGVCGCQSRTQTPGLYLPRNGGDEYAAVYKDLIFIHVLRPDSMPGEETYWDWAGKYEINDDGEILFDMDKDELRDWSFYYTFHAGNSGIRVENLSDVDKSYTLHRRPVQRRKVIPAEDVPVIEPMY